MTINTINIAPTTTDAATKTSRRCPRCIGGYLIRESWDLVCLNCGYRRSINLDAEIDDLARNYDILLALYGLEPVTIKLRWTK